LLQQVFFPGLALPGGVFLPAPGALPSFEKVSQFFQHDRLYLTVNVKPSRLNTPSTKRLTAGNGLQFGKQPAARESQEQWVEIRQCPPHRKPSIKSSTGLSDTPPARAITGQPSSAPTMLRVNFAGWPILLEAAIQPVTCRHGADR
jgi:hypothetical protein